MMPPTIALIDPIWVGHHPMYFGEFGAAFMRLGARVVGFCPNPEAAVTEIRQASGDPEADVHCYPLKTGEKSFLNGRFEGDPWHTLRRWQYAATAIQKVEEETGVPFDLVYFPYLDSYLRFLPVPGIPESTIGRPWSGLYLRNHHYRHHDSLLQPGRILAKGDRLIRSKSCQGIGVLDERYGNALEAHVNHPVTPFPDVTLTELPATPSDFSREIQDKAKGRKIIGLIGLEKRKGAMTMLQLARRAQELREPWYFVFAGSFDANQFTPKEQTAFAELREDIVSNAIDHVHFDPSAGRIPSELDYNSLFSSFDLAWAAYLDFPGSSGTLSKAAAFEIPVIATDGECIGERVNRHRLGGTITQGSVEEALEALRQQFAHPENRDYAGYREAHSRQRLDNCLAEILGRLPRTPLSPQT